MSMALLIICLVSGTASFISFLFDRRKHTKIAQRITHVLAVISLVAAISSGALSYWASIETERNLQLAQAEAAAARVQIDKAHAQITEIRTPRRMAPETKRRLVAQLKPYAGQKYDMKVFRDRDSLELARALQTSFEKAGWVYTDVYPRYGTHYAETHDDGVWVISAEVQTRRSSKARSALHGSLKEAGLYDDSNVVSPKHCAKATGPIEKGTKITRIPCAESPVKIIKLYFIVVDNVIPEDTLVLHVGRQRL